MKLQLGELRSMVEVLPDVLKNEMPIKTAYWLTRAYNGMMNEFRSFEEARKMLIEKYATKDADGEFITAETDDGKTTHVFEDMEAFEAEFIELAEEEIEIKYNPISLEAFGDILITGETIVKLGRLIKDDEEIAPLSVIDGA